MSFGLFFRTNLCTHRGSCDQKLCLCLFHCSTVFLVNLHQEKESSYSIANSDPTRPQVFAKNLSLWLKTQWFIKHCLKMRVGVRLWKDHGLTASHFYRQCVISLKIFSCMSLGSCRFTICKTGTRFLLKLLIKKENCWTMEQKEKQFLVTAVLVCAVICYEKPAKKKMLMNSPIQL